VNLVPKVTKLLVKQHTHRATATQLKAADHVFLLEPKKAAKRLLKTRPLHAAVEHLRSAHKTGTSMVTHPGDARQSGFTHVYYADKLTAYDRLSIAKRLFAALGSLNPSSIAVVCNEEDDQLRALWCEAITAAGYAWVTPLTTFKKKRQIKRKLRQLELYMCPGFNADRTRAEARGNNIARVLAALPPNVLNAANYIEECRQLARTHKVEFELYDQSRLKQMGAGAFLAVAQANPHGSAGIVKLKRPGDQERPWLSLVGKGVCFDTGGANLKSARYMQEMHEDMQGSSVALGAFLTLCELAPTKHLECWLAITENRLDGDAYTPTEIITAINGRTIEVMHTDAEGRMALTDTLWLAAQSKPMLTVDFATLTGACVSALTERYSGTFSNRSDLNSVIMAAGEQSGERVWPFPMDADYDELLRSQYADYRQCPIEGTGDHIAAARLLGHFIGDRLPWIHVDLSAGHKKGGYAHVNTDTTGFGVRMLCNLVLDQDAHAHLR